MNVVAYVHGKGGSAAESARFAPLFPGCRVVGVDYKTATPWETGKEIRAALKALKTHHEEITLIANSIGAFFAMHADIGPLVARAFFISPVVDMEKLILDMMAAARVAEETLKEKGVIPTPFGEDLSWEYLSYVRAHPIRWNVPTEILYGKLDELTAFETVLAFAEKTGAGLTVMESGGHWFHTPEELRFLDAWLKKSENAAGSPIVSL